MCPGKYTIMGQVIDGMDVLDKLEKLPVGELIRTHKLLSLQSTPAYHYVHMYIPAGLQAHRTVQHRRLGFHE